MLGASRLTCLRCDHNWQNRFKGRLPRVCPGCRSPYWETPRKKPHGMARTPEWTAWSAMRGRCTNENGKFYRHYGGRGIKVCPEWEEFERFYADMGNRPSPDHSVDRIDVNGDYAPSNCRWATRVEQGRNKRNNRLISWNGETLRLTEWSERSGLSIQLIWWRIRMKWELGRALNEPTDKNRGHPMPEHQRIKVSQPKTAETRAKMSAGAIKWRAERRAKRAEIGATT